MPEYKRDLKTLFCTGIDLGSPVDSIKDGYYPILENMRSYTDGVIQPRVGLTSIANVITGQTPVHSIRRLNNPLNSTYTRVVGVGTKLATGQASFTAVQHNGSDVAFSGKPLALVPWRPEQSPVSWMYVADSNAMYKVTYNGSAVTTHKIGITPPAAPPTIELDTPKLRGNGPPFVLGSIFQSTTGWATTAPTGIAGAVSHGDRFTGRAITAVIWDSGTNGWASIVPASMTDIGPGTLIAFVHAIEGTENIMVWEVYRSASPASNTVNKILYDNDPTNTGACTIVPTGTTSEIKRNCVVLLNGGTNYFRVTEVIKGADNTVVAFRCNTGSTTISAGQSLAVVDSFRVWAAGGSVQLNTSTTMQSDRNYSTFTPSGANLTGTITYVPPAAVDMTYAVSITSTIGDLDYLHFSFKMPDLSQLTQLRIMFDVDDGTFAKNFYYRAITPSDLVTAAKGTKTTVEARIDEINRAIVSQKNEIIKETKRFGTSGDRGVIGTSFRFSRPADEEPDTKPPDDPITNPGDQTGTGDSQWHEIRFRRGDCIRVGTDWSKGWKAVNAIRFEGVFISGGLVQTLEFSSFNIFGGSSPDIGDIGAEYLYRYRYRSSTTGVASNWSPATRSGIISLRVPIKISYTAPSLTSELNLVDIQRWGGLVTAWANIGTDTALGSPFTDNSDDDFAFGALPDSDGNINFQPWISSQTPVSGTASTVAGTLLKDSGTNFSTSWLRGTAIKVNGIHTSIRRIHSTSVLEVEDCVGAGSNLDWEIAEPFIQEDLPCLWGPVNGWFFGCGDATNPGRLYWSNRNNPDSTQDSFWLDVTAPSEPLQNGFSYNGRNYVFSTDNLYEIVEISNGQFIPRVTPIGRGLMYRWAFTVGPKIWFLSKDGIYEADGGSSSSLTVQTLFPFFPKEGQAGTATNGFNPPNMTTGNLTISGITADASTFFRLAYYDSHLYFIYPDTNNRIRSLVYKLGSLSLVQGTTIFGWFPDVYNPGNTNTGVFCMYGEEGDGIHTLLMGGADTTTAKVYSYGGTTDAGTDISWHFRQPSFDVGDKRADKDWKDFVVSADAGGGTINVAAGINEYASTVTLNNPATGAATITGTGRTKATFDINTGNGVEARNFAVDLSGTGTAARLYFIETAFAPRPEDSYRRATQYEDAGYPGEKWVQGILLEADTQNIAKTIEVQYDGGTVGDTLTITHNGRRLEPYSFASGFVARMLRLAPADNDLLKLYSWKWVAEPEPPLVTVWDTQQTSHGHIGFIHLKEIWITHTSTANLTLTITRMDDNTSQSFTIAHSAGVRGKETRILLGPAEFCKGKTFKYKITQATNTPFRIYQKNCGVLVKPWGSAQAYARWAGWGAVHGDGGAQI